MKDGSKWKEYRVVFETDSKELKLRFGAENMKSLQLYVCDHCGTQYKDKNECKQCESNHKSALEIHDMRFHASKESINYPDKVELKMADGKMIWYHR